jgi:hypothetical protein
MLASHCHHDRDKLVGMARRTATAPQRKALAESKHP